MDFGDDGGEVEFPNLNMEYRDSRVVMNLDSDSEPENNVSMMSHTTEGGQNLGQNLDQNKIESNMIELSDQTDKGGDSEGGWTPFQLMNMMGGMRRERWG